jgi:hypothetical protein
MIDDRRTDLHDGPPRRTAHHGLPDQNARMEVWQVLRIGFISLLFFLPQVSTRGERETR